MEFRCLHIPRRITTDATAFYDTAWELVNPKYLWHFYEDLSESENFPFSVELIAEHNTVYYSLASTPHGLEIFRTGFASFLPDAELHPIADRLGVEILSDRVVVSNELIPIRSDIFPFENFYPFATDTMNSALAKMSALPPEDGLCLQLICRPHRRGWWPDFALNCKRRVNTLLDVVRPYRFFRSDLPNDSKKRVNDKSLAKLFWVSVRLSAFAPQSGDPARDKLTHQRLDRHIRDTWSLLAMVNLPDQNGLRMGERTHSATARRRITARSFIRPWRLSAIEVSTLIHPPGLGSLPNTAQVLTRKLLPSDAVTVASSGEASTTLGVSAGQTTTSTIGLHERDRMQHLRIIGAPGTGPSQVLEILGHSDLTSGRQAVVFDSGGGLVTRLLSSLAEDGTKKPLLFDPTDEYFIPCFNPLVSSQGPSHSAEEFLVAFEFIMGNEWVPRMEHIVSMTVNSLRAVLPTNLYVLKRFLADPDFRGEVLELGNEEAARRFWLSEYPRNESGLFATIVLPMINRLETLTALKSGRNVFSSFEDRFSATDILRGRESLLLNLSRETLGEPLSSFLGVAWLWRIYLAAVSRERHAEGWAPVHFFIDDLSLFATPRISEVLAECRKFGVTFSMAYSGHEELPAGIGTALSSTCGNTIALRTGPADARMLAAEFQPLSQTDLLSLGEGEFYAKLSIDGAMQPPFWGRLSSAPSVISEGVQVEQTSDAGRRYSMDTPEAERLRALSEGLSARQLQRHFPSPRSSI
jgi:Type IV secretion-system coupling protein DNA-binding domain